MKGNGTDLGLQESTASFSTIWDSVLYIANAGGTVINLIFLGWILIACLIVLVISQFAGKQDRQHHYNHEKSQWTPNFNRSIRRSKDAATNTSHSEGGVLKHTDSSQFKIDPDLLRIVIHWLQNGSNCWKEPIIERILSNLTKHSEMRRGDIFMRFSSIEAEEAPTIIIKDHRYTDSNMLVLVTRVFIQNLKFNLTTSDYASALVHSNAVLLIKTLDIQAEIPCTMFGHDMNIKVNLKEVCESQLQYFPYYPELDVVSDDTRIISHFMDIMKQTQLSLTLTLQQAIEPVACLEQPIVFQALHEVESACPPKPPRLIEDKRLMLKLIKATKLNQYSKGVINASCNVEIDSPIQKQTTSVVKNTVNPYWDEHFLFDLGPDTRRITFRMLCESEHDEPEECIGYSEIELEHLRANPGVRMVLPLNSTTGADSQAFGSVTIEAYFVDSAEFDRVHDDDEDVFIQSVEPMGPLVVTSTEDNDDVQTPSSANYNYNDINEEFNQLFRQGENIQKDNSPPIIIKNIERPSTMHLSISHEDMMLDDPDSRSHSLGREFNREGHSSIDASRLSTSYDHRSTSSHSPVPGYPEENNGERKSRFSSLKKRFTKTKDKKPRSHSLDRVGDYTRSSNHGDVLEAEPIHSGSKKKFGGSLRKLFHRQRKSPSENILNDLDKPFRKY